jgi:carbonic anhydrase/acetyltransferase-like protein (isoleucine patch superfamily)
LGRVQIGPGCYIGAGAVLRGDWVTISVGAGSNVQDNCVIHGDPGGQVLLAEDAHLGHGCVVHSARVGRNSLVGMMAVVSDGADLGEDCIVGAGALVPAGMVVPAGMLAVGVPARVVGEVRPELALEKRRGTRWYQELARRCRHEVNQVQLDVCLQGESPAEEEAESLRVESAEWRPWIEDTEMFRPPAGSGGSTGGSL